MATKDSTLYTNVYVNKYPADARDGQARVVYLPFEHTIVTEVSGDDVRLLVLPANCEVIGFGFQTDGVGGTGTTLIIGDSGDTNRFMLAIDVDTELTVIPMMPFTGFRFRPTADTIVLGTWGIDNPVAANIFKGYFLIAPGA